MSEIPRENNPEDTHAPDGEKSIDDYIKEGKNKTRIVQIICSNCNAILGEKEVSDTGLDVSHGMCEKCAKELYGDEMAAIMFPKEDKYDKRDIDKNAITENID
jgi:hypothetical protein